LIAALIACAAPCGAAERPRESAAGLARLRWDLLEEINADRARRGREPLRLDERLNEYAQARAEQVARQGDEDPGSWQGEPGARSERLRATGYEPYLVAEVYAQSPGDAAEMVATWRRGGGETYRDALDRQYRDAGIGIAELGGQPFYLFLFAESLADHFAGATEGLADLDLVRQELLGLVNARRRERGRGALRPSLLLDAAAQRYAEEMLRTGHYGHVGPRGENALDRARRAGYRPAAVAENLAKGHYSVADVVAGWMESRDHRANLLHPQYFEMGAGMAYGQGPDGPVVLWVQLFGIPRT
jgi:uncharacterized protein YkwD